MMHLKRTLTTIVLALILSGLLTACQSQESLAPTGTPDGAPVETPTYAPTAASTAADTQDGVLAGNIGQVFDEVLPYDPAATPPSSAAAALRALATFEPDAAELVSDMETAERSALQTLLADVKSQLGMDESASVPSPARKPVSMKVAHPPSGAVLPVVYTLQGDVGGPIDTAHDAGLIAGLTTGLSDIMNPNIPAGASAGGSATETSGDATTTMTLNVGRSADGSTQFSWGTKGKSTKNGVTGNVDVAVSIDGQRCPNADGQVSFTVKMRLGADSGGAGYTQDLTAFVRATVDDNAQIASTTFDLTQGTRQVKAGRQVYVESGMTVKYDGENSANYTISNLRLIRSSQDVTPDDAGNLSASGHEAAVAMAMAVLELSKHNWESGGCVQIEAKSPGTVPLGSTTAIPVTVRHRFDGAEVPSKLEVAFTGEKAVDPASLAKTPGTLTYTAPGERLKSATITLTATSRRGKATLQLMANTGGQAYRVSGASNHASFIGQICSLEKTFTIEATFPGGTATTFFTPENGPDGGITAMEGEGSGCTQSGAGTYTVALNEDGSGTVTWTDTATLTCPGISNNRTATFTLPLQPAPDLSCP